MSKLMTKEYVNQMQFFQMPKAFFHDPRYMSLRCESKLAYMLMLDLLPLSIENNWVNDHNQVFVKISREKLMAMLNVRGTQKAAQIMKELVDYKLIIYKRVGLARCNEIYLYPPAGSITMGPGVPKSSAKNSDELVEVQECVGGERVENLEIPAEEDKDHVVTNVDVDMEEIEFLLEDQIHMADLRQKYDCDLVDEIGNNICEMFLNPTTRIGKQDKPRAIMRSVIRKLKMHHIEHVIDQFKKTITQTEIFNTKRYIQTMIYNSVYEANIKITGDVGYTFGYC